MTTVEAPPIETKPWQPLKLPDWAEKITERVKVDIQFDPPLSLTAAQKLRLELIWMDHRCRNPCNWTRWTHFAQPGYGHNEGDGIYSSKGRLSYPVQSEAAARRKLKLRYSR